MCVKKIIFSTVSYYFKYPSLVCQVYGTILSRGHYAQQHILSLDQMSVTSECHYMPQVYSNDGEIDLHLGETIKDVREHDRLTYHTKDLRIILQLRL